MKEEQNMQCCISQCDRPLDQAYWNSLWEKEETGWDIGKASPAIADYMAQYPLKEASILLPGCGNAYEAEYLIANGFAHITLIDIAPKAVESLKLKFAHLPQVRVMCEDFFLHQGKYDVIIEQTFFCAIPPNRMKEYAEKAASLLKENGKIIGVLFDRTFGHQGPPFGGCPCKYKPLFEPHFAIHKMEKCYNSIPQRADTEVFIHLIKQSNQ